jgi:6-phosphogluconolactonase
VTAPKPPPRRVTVGYDVLQRAENVWVLVSGPGKEDALKQSLTAGDRTPLGRVLGGRSGTRIYTDLSPAGGFGA